MKHLLIFFTTTIILVLCATSCATVSVLADVAGATGIIDKNVASGVSKSSAAIGKASEEITPQQEYYIGRAVAATIAGRYTIYKAKPEMQNYLNSILQTLALNSQKPELYKGYSIAILDTDEFNAFATSGGHVFVSRGLLRTAENEDELAAVIAHEVGHIQLSHSIKAIKNNRFTNALAVTATSSVSIYASAQGADELASLVSTFSDSIGEVVTTLIDSGYSKSQEFDADAASMEILSNAGYDPAALITVLELMAQHSGEHSGGFTATHPSPKDRIKDAKKNIKKIPAIENPTAVEWRKARFATAMASL